MFTRLTKTSWIVPVVLVVLAVAVLIPTLFAHAQGSEADLQAAIDAEAAAQNFPNTPPPGTLEGEELLFQQPVLTGDPVTDAEALANARAAGADAIRQAGIDTSSTQGNQTATEVFADSPLKKWLYLFVVNFFGFLVFAGGYLLDFAVNNFVINFGLEFNTSGVGEAVNELWSVVRDFFNILFIFGFIWIGFQMILDSGNSRAKQTLVSLIMAALLVNFSLFISKFVVDFSNRLASEVAIAAFPAAGGNGNVDIADTFFAHLGVSETLQVPDAIANGGVEPWAFIFGSAIFYLVAAFVFAAGGVMLIIRFVALSIFMVLSPFMFLGWVFPGLQGWTSKYWKGFLGRAFYAPVYIVLLFFAGSILQRMFREGTGSSEVTVGEGGLLSAVTNNQNNLIEVLGPFVLSMAFMLAAVIVAGKMSADGAGGVMKVGNTLQRGGRRFVARNTVGLGAYGVSAAGRGAGKYVERFDAASQSSRGARIARGALNTVTLGATSNKSLKAATGAMAGASVAGSQTREQYVKEQSERKKVNARITTRSADEAAIKAAEGIDPNDPNLTDEQKALLDKRESAINNYSSTELEEMGEKKRNKLVGMLKAGTVSKLLDSDNLSSTEKASLQQQYRETIEAKVLDSNKEVITEELTKLSEKQLEILGTEFAETYAGSFSDTQMDGFKKSDAFTERQKDSFKASRIKDHKNKTVDFSGRKALFKDTELKVVDGKRTAVHKDKPKKAPQIAALPYEAFVDNKKLNPDAVEYISADVLRNMARNAAQGKPAPTDDQRQELALELLDNPNISIAVTNYLTSSKGMEDFGLTKDLISQKQTGSWSDSLV